MSADSQMGLRFEAKLGFCWVVLREIDSRGKLLKWKAKIFPGVARLVLHSYPSGRSAKRTSGYGC